MHIAQQGRPVSFRVRLAGTLLFALGTAAMAVLTASAQAQDKFPSRSIELIVPFPPGGATDVQARTLGAAASKELGQSIVIVNAPGASATLGPASMARTAKPDGYTLSFTPASLFRLPHLQHVNFDPLQDFTYIIGLTSYTYGLVVPMDSKWKTVADLVADAKTRPGQITYGAIGVSGSGNIAMERFAKASGTKFNFAPFQGAADVTQAVIGGHIDLVSDGSLGTMSDTGKLRVIATATEKRVERFPDVPTLKELGYDVVIQSILGIGGPKGMDPKVVQILHDAFRKAMDDPSYRKALQAQAQPVEYMNSSDYTAYARRQYESDKAAVQELKALLNR